MPVGLTQCRFTILTRLNLRSKAVRSLDCRSCPVNKEVGGREYREYLFQWVEHFRKCFPRRKRSLCGNTSVSLLLLYDRAIWLRAYRCWVANRINYYLFWSASVVAAVMYCSIATHTPYHTMDNTVRFYHFCGIDRTPSRDVRCMTLYPPMAWQQAPLMLYINFRTDFILHFPLQRSATCLPCYADTPKQTSPSVRNCVNRFKCLRFNCLSHGRTG